MPWHKAVSHGEQLLPLGKGFKDVLSWSGNKFFTAGEQVEAIAINEHCIETKGIAKESEFTFRKFSVT